MEKLKEEEIRRTLKKNKKAVGISMEICGRCYRRT